MKTVLAVSLLLAAALTAFADLSVMAPGAKGFTQAEDRSPGNSVFTRIPETWQTKASLPESICGNMVVPITLGGTKYVYSFGGGVLRGGNEVLIDSIYIYDIANDSWAISSVHMPSPIDFECGVACGDKVYFFGGWNGAGIVGFVRIFHLADSTWSLGATMSVSCSDQVAFVYQDSLIYVVGGVTTYFTRYTNTVQIYNRNQNTWTSGTPLPDSLGCAGGGVVGNTAVFSGGIGYHGGTYIVSDTTFEGAINPSDPTQITWTAVTGSPYPTGPRYRLTSGTVGNQVFVGNGLSEAGGIFRQTYSYDPSTHAWTSHPNKPTPIEGVANYAVMDSVLYVPGGYRNAPLAVHEALNLKLTGMESGPPDRLEPNSLALGQAYPNPCRSRASIRFSLPRDGEASLVVYNHLGQPVATLVSGEVKAGAHTAAWNGRTDQGKPAPSGVYLYRLQADSQSRTGKLVLMR